MTPTAASHTHWNAGTSPVPPRPAPSLRMSRRATGPMMFRTRGTRRERRRRFPSIRLVAAWPTFPDPNAPGGAHKVALKYDYLGRRVEKTVYNWVSGQWQAGPIRRFVWSGWLLLMELDGMAGGTGVSPVRKYTWGLDLAGQMGGAGASERAARASAFLEGAGGIGGLLAMSDPNDPNDPNDPFGDFVYFYDGKGDWLAAGCRVPVPFAVAHDANDPAGALVAKYEYDPYGQRINHDGSVPEYDQPK